MSRLGKFALSLGAVALLCTPALAQRPGGGGFGGGPGGGTLMLLRNKSVAQELKLSDDQEARLKVVAEENRDKFRAAFQSAQDLDPAERARRWPSSRRPHKRRARRSSRRS